MEYTYLPTIDRFYGKTLARRLQFYKTASHTGNIYIIMRPYIMVCLNC